MKSDTGYTKILTTFFAMQLMGFLRLLGLSQTIRV